MKKCKIILLLGLCFFLVSCKMSRYNDAIALFNDGKYDEAIDIFEEMPSYKEANYYLNISNDLKKFDFKKCDEKNKIFDYTRNKLTGKEYLNNTNVTLEEYRNNVVNYKNRFSWLFDKKWSASYSKVVGKKKSILDGKEYDSTYDQSISLAFELKSSDDCKNFYLYIDGAYEHNSYAQWAPIAFNFKKNVDINNIKNRRYDFMLLNADFSKNPWHYYYTGILPFIIIDEQQKKIKIKFDDTIEKIDCKGYKR